MPEAVPGVIWRGAGAVSARFRIGSVAVEIPAVVPGVVEHAVQDHAHALRLCRSHQAVERRLATEGGVDSLVIPRVVLMVGMRVEDGGEIQHGHPQGGKIGQLFDNAPEVAAEKHVVGKRAAALLGIGGDAVIPARIQNAVVVQGGVPCPTAEAIHENVVHHALPKPVRHPEIRAVKQEPEFPGALRGKGKVQIVFRVRIAALLRAQKNQLIVKQPAAVPGAVRGKIR
ncbi:putative uncharacterized protein [Clostridium sp. CAG:448]|nr:putative uncharacterized protein [Clostridium sp. CAG:448]